MNKLTSLGFISLFTLLILAGCQTAEIEKEQEMTPPNTESSAEVEPVSNTDEEVAWQAYENKDLAFKWDLPSTITVDEGLNGKNNQTVSFTRTEGMIVVKLNETDKQPSMNPEDYEYDVTNISESTLGGQKAVVITSSTGICDGPGCSGPFVAYMAINGAYSYSLTFYGDTALDDTEQKMIDSFEFTGEVAPQATEAINALKPVEE